MALHSVFLLACSLVLFLPKTDAQENCIFKANNMKGGYYLFATYYQPDLKTRLEGSCETYINGRLYESRRFHHGHIMEESLNDINFKPRIKVVIIEKPADSIIAIYKEWQETGELKKSSNFYLDRSGRRCEAFKEFYPNGTVKMSINFAFVRAKELNDQEVKNYPEHRIDEYGYTSLKVPFGEELHYYENGQIKTSIHHQLILGKASDQSSKNGLYKSYFMDGSIQECGQYLNGHQHGNWVQYTINKNKISESFYNADSKIGLWKAWHDNGLPKYEFDYTNPNSSEINKIEWNGSGIKIAERKVDHHGHGFQKKWSNEGKLIEEIDIIENSSIKGIEKYWYENGQLKTALNHLPNVDTFYLEYYTTGQLKQLQLHLRKDGKTISDRKEWNEQGILIEQVIKTTAKDYDNLELFNFYGNGNEKSKIFHKNNERIEEYYYPNGRKRKSMLLHHGLLEGSFQLFDTIGNKLTSISYSSGIRNGRSSCYSSSGEIKLDHNYIHGCLDKSNKNIGSIKHRNLKDIPLNEKKMIYSNVFHMLGLIERADTTKIIFDWQEIDSMATRFLWLSDTWKLQGRLPFTTYPITSQEISFTLPRYEYIGLDKKDTSNPIVKKLIQTFDSLNWVIPTWKIIDDKFIATYNEGRFYTIQFLKHVFKYEYEHQFIKSNSHTMDKGIEDKFQYPSTPMLVSMLRINKCCFLAGVKYEHKNKQFMIYNSAEVEFYNQSSSWNKE